MNKVILLLAVLLTLAGNTLRAQIVFSDDFSTSQSSTYSTTGTIGSNAWTVNRGATDYGARVNTNGYLDLTSDALGDNTTTGGSSWVFVYQNASTAFASPYNTTLHSNTSDITWTFNMRTSSGLGGFSTGSYGDAFILGSTVTNPYTSGQGYAVVMGETGGNKHLRLAKFNNGLDGTLTDILTTSNSFPSVKTDYISVRVVYTPSTNTWKMYSRDDGTTTFTNPAYGTGTSGPTSGLALNGASASATDNTYTTTSLPYVGAFFQGSNGSGNTAYFDNITVWEGPTFSVTSLAAFGNTCAGTTVGPNSFIITGSNITSGTVSVSALSGYNFNTTSGSSCCPSLGIGTGVDGSFYQTVYVWFTPTAAQSYNGNIVIGDGVAPNINVAASGAGSAVCSASFSGTCAGAGTLTWTLGSGFSTTNDRVVIFAKASSAINVGSVPNNSPNSYTASSAFGSGSAYPNDASAFCVYNGTGSSVNITDLAANTTYYFTLFHVMVGPNVWAVDASTSGTTPAGPSPVTSATGTIGNGQVALSWTNPSCYDEIMVIARQSATAPTSTPTGNGTLYTASSVYADPNASTNNNLTSGEYDVYQSTGSSVTVTGLTNNLAYSFAIYARSGTSWSLVTTVVNKIPLGTIGPWRTLASGNWTSNTTWQRLSGGVWVNAAVGEYPNGTASTNSVQIRNGHTVTVNGTGPYDIYNLDVMPGGKLYANSTTTNTYLTVWGTVINCAGTAVIGNYPTADAISFNIEGSACSITDSIGSGASTNFSCSRIRKNSTTATTTGLTFNRNAWLGYNGTEIYNNAAPSNFNVIIASGYTVTCGGTTFTGSPVGNVSIDGPSGVGAGNIGGTITVNGTLTISGTLYLTTNNTANACNVTVAAAGTLNAAAINASATTTAGMMNFTLNESGATGATFNITGTGAFTSFNTTNNTFNLGTYYALVNYSAAGAQPVRSELNYPNLTLSGSGSKTPTASAGTALTVQGNLTIAGSAVLVPAAGTQINVHGNWTSYGPAGFTAGTSTVNLNGSSQVINTTGGETFYNLTMGSYAGWGVTLASDITVSHVLDLGTNSGTFGFGSAAHTVTLSDMSAGSNGFLGGASTNVLMSGVAHNFYIGSELASFSGSLTSNSISTTYYNRNSGTGNQNVLGGTNIQYGNLYLSGSAGTTRNKTLQGDVQVTGNFTADGVNLDATSGFKTMSLTGNFTLQNGGATTSTGARVYLTVQTVGSGSETFTGNGTTIQLFGITSSKSGGGLALAANTTVDLKNDLLIDFTGSALFTDGGNAITVGRNAGFGSTSSASTNYTMTGTLKMTNENVASGSFSNISDVAVTNVSKAQLNNLVVNIASGALSAIVRVLPTSSTQVLTVNGNVSITNSNSQPNTALQMLVNTMLLKGNLSTFNHTGFVPGSGKVTFGGGAAQTMTSGDYVNYNDLEINNANGMTLLVNAQVNGNLFLTNGLINTGANELQVLNTSAASVPSGSTTSYINGNLRRYVGSSGSYDFPIGTSANYERANLTLNSQTGISNILGFFTSGLPATMPNPATCFVNGTAITSMLNGGYWTLTPNAYTAVNYDVTLYEKGYSNFTGVAAQLGVIKRTSSASPWLGTNTSGGTGGTQGLHSNATQSISGGTATAKRSGVQSFSDFGIGFGNTPLPVTLTTFTATLATNQTVDVNWTTMSEYNNAYFNVQRSTDAETFTTIAKVTGHGTTESINNYFVNDAHPNNGVNYYRLEQVDFDGNVQYSNVQAVTIVKTGTVALYPNPTGGMLNIVGIDNGATVQVFDLTGRLVMQHASTNATDMFDASKLTPGNYFIRVTNTDGTSWKTQFNKQ